MKNLRGKRVLITGGAGGIGLCTAEEFARAGSEVIITDIDGERLDQAKTKLSEYGIPIHTRVVDVVDRQQVNDLARWVLEDVGGLDVLINNAGIGYNGELADTTLETWQKLLAVNLLGPLYHIYAFLPYFKEKRGGHIVNVSSGQTYFRLPTWGAYASIKAAFGAFSEILYFELRKYHVKVTTVYPFMVNTPFYKDIQGDTWGAKLSMKLIPYYSMTPEKVARIIFRAVKKEIKVERVSVINDLGRYAQLVPFANDIMALTSNFFLAKKAERPV
jgi:NAD(P)-dependent dehydrogenase (short-subunit alcohol dehydrogenase family)